MKKKILIVIAMLAALFSTPAGITHVNAEDENRIVYVSKTGSKYHYSSICSGMKNPRSVTLREAKAMGRQPCEKCVSEEIQKPEETQKPGGVDKPGEVQKPEEVKKPIGVFSDVFEDTPHAYEILWTADSEISKGWTEPDGTKTFRPYVDVARCDMAAFIRRLAVSNNWLDAATWKPGEEDWNTFTDVDTTTAHAEDVLWLAHSGISEGWDVGNGQKEFRPYIDVARCDMAAFIRRLAVSNNWLDATTWKPDEADWTFADIDAGSPHAEDVMWLAHSEISQGWAEADGTKTFRPLNNVARCDMAAFLRRLVG